MLQVDLARLRNQRRVRLVEEVPPDAMLFRGADVELVGPLHVELEAQQAGSDVVVRGELEGEVAGQCRRCLKPLVLDVREPFSALFTEHVTEEEVGEGEVYPLPARTAVLDLSEPVRESFLLAVPAFAVCDVACRGLCPTCGTNLNESECDCAVEETDERWAPLRRMKLDD